MTTVHNMNRAYRIALICGVVPLTVGIFIFILWLVTRWDWLETAGLITIVGGCASFPVGMMALGYYCWIEGYVTNGLGGHAEVVINQDGTFSVSDLSF